MRSRKYKHIQKPVQAIDGSGTYKAALIPSELDHGASRHRARLSDLYNDAAMCIISGQCRTNRFSFFSRPKFRCGVSAQSFTSTLGHLAGHNGGSGYPTGRTCMTKRE